MFKCPKCGKEFSYLHAYLKECNTYYFDSGGNYEWKDAYTVETEYVCPGCGETLTMDEEEAMRLLEKEASAEQTISEHL